MAAKEPHKGKASHAIGWLAGSLIAWATVLAIGAFVFGYRSDVRKPLIIVGVMVTFIAIWMTLLVLRQRRLSR